MDNLFFGSPLALDPVQGDLWLATGGGVLHWQLEENRFTRYASEHGLPGNSVVAVAVDGLGEVWAACGGRVGLATEAGWTPLGEKRLNTPITRLAAASDDQVWIGTHDGLLRGGTEGIRLHLTDTPPDVIGLPSGDRSPATLSNLVQALSVQQLAERSILWIGTARGLFRLDLFTENWRRYGRLGTQDIRAIATTPDQETVWVGSWSSGLHGLKQQTELEATPKVSEPILALTAGTSQCWAVGLDGLYQYIDSDWLYYRSFLLKNCL